MRPVDGTSLSHTRPTGAVGAAFSLLVTEIRACVVCAPHLPLGPRPILRGAPSARLLIISQAL